MKLSYFTLLFIFLFSVNLSAQNVFVGDVKLTNQAQVTAFGANNYTKIVGFLGIKGDDITDLSSLNTLDTITHSLFFEYNRKLLVLNGFDELAFIGGGLYIDGNTELDTIATFGKVKMIKGPLVLRDNHLLRECCALYPLVSGEQGVVLGGNFIYRNKGCQDEKELRENCDGDADNDGVDDSMDECPNDPNKFIAGKCGCGVSDLDSDRDGTPDCNDKCPDDPNKIVAGDCGCGKEDMDSDNDGVADCNDQCPDNPNKTIVGVCGCVDPRILNMTITNIGNCNDNGTPSTLDDTYTADINLTFERAPTSGTVLITGDATSSISFSSSSTSKTYTLSGLNFKADGNLIEVIATFEGNSPCKFRRVYGIFAPSSCSTGACDAPSNIKIDTEDYPNGALISWMDMGPGTEYEINYRPLGNNNWANRIAKTNQLQISGLSDYTTYEYQIRSICDGQKLSAYATGQFTTGGKECKLIRAEVQNISCNDNQTPNDTSDDYFTFGLYVEGTNTGANYTVANVTDEQTGEYQKLNTFRTTSGTLGQGDIQITITDNIDANCQLVATVADPGMCSNDCQIDYITIDSIIKCYDRGSNWVTSDDFFTGDLTVHFTNPPAIGELKLTGRPKGSVSTENLQGRTSYTFQAVRIPATGKDFVLGAEFTNGLNCNYEAGFSGVLIKNDKICWEQCNIMNAQTRNVQCADNGTPNDTSDDYLTFELIVTGVNLGENYRVNNVAGASLGIYNEPSFFRTNGGNTNRMIDIEIRDDVAGNCHYSISLENDCSSNGRTGNLQKELSNKKLNVYPNPARNELTIDYSASENVHVEIYDLLGRSIISKELTTNNIDISQLNKGIYHLIVKEGDSVLTKKFIKE